LAATAGIIYSRVYFFANEADFSKIVNLTSMVSLNVMAGLLISLLHVVFSKWVKKNPEFLFNLTISILSFALIIIPISISLPLTVESPELFPGLVVPMLFFPALAWLSLSPLFNNHGMN
jgi:hypothetical protein